MSDHTLSLFLRRWTGEGAGSPGSERVVVSRGPGQGFRSSLSTPVSPGDPCRRCPLLPGLYYTHAPRRAFPPKARGRLPPPPTVECCSPFRTQCKYHLFHEALPDLPLAPPPSSAPLSASSLCITYTFVITLILSFLRSVDVSHRFYLDGDLLERRNCVFSFFCQVSGAELGT